MLFEINPEHRTVTHTQRELNTNDLIRKSPNHRYRVYAKPGAGPAFTMGGYPAKLYGTCFVEVLENITPEDFRLRVQFL